MKGKLTTEEIGETTEINDQEGFAQPLPVSWEWLEDGQPEDAPDQPWSPWSCYGSAI